MAKEISSELLNTILTRVGGPGNIASCGNCMTRLRLGVHDSSCKTAIVMVLKNLDAAEAKKRLDQHGGFIRQVLDKE